MRVLFLLLAPLLGWSLATQLLTPAELQKRVPMTELTDFTKLPLRIHTPDFLLISQGRNPRFILEGRDKRGRNWRVGLRDAARSAWASEAGGRGTYYFTGYTGSTGMGPMTWILALTFDDEGRPVPFFATTQGSIGDVLNLDGTGPEILIQEYQGDRNDPGYYVTTLYQQRGAYWYRSDGRHGAHQFPASEKWSVMWRDKPAVLTSPPVFKWAARDSGNDPARGIAAEIARVEKSGVVDVEGVSGCSVVSPAVVVVDSADGRSIEMERLTEPPRALAGVRSRIVLTGLYRWPYSQECDAAVVWASTGP